MPNLTKNVAVLPYLTRKKVGVKMSTENTPLQFTVAILPINKVSNWQIEFTKDILSKEFKVETTVLSPFNTDSKYFDSEKGVYQAVDLLEHTFFFLPAQAQRIMGIVVGEMEGEQSKSYYHGCAYSYHRTALCSVAVASSDDHEMLNLNDIFYYRTVVHEIGHTLGIEHCNSVQCVMKVTPDSTNLCDKCKRWADRELRVALGSAEERFSLAESFFQKKCFRQAITAYNQAISRAPYEPLYHHRLGLALARTNQKERASKAMMSALDNSNGDPKSFYNLGLLSMGLDIEKTEDYFSKAITIAKDQKFMHRLTGQAYREIVHDVKRASWHYKEYLRLGGDDPDIIDWLVSRSQLPEP